MFTDDIKQQSGPLAKAQPNLVKFKFMTTSKLVSTWWWKCLQWKGEVGIRKSTQDIESHRGSIEEGLNAGPISAS